MGIIEIALITIGGVTAFVLLGIVIGFENLFWLGTILEFMSDFWD